MYDHEIKRETHVQKKNMLLCIYVWSSSEELVLPDDLERGSDGTYHILVYSSCGSRLVNYYVDRETHTAEFP